MKLSISTCSSTLKLKPCQVVSSSIRTSFSLPCRATLRHGSDDPHLFLGEPVLQGSGGLRLTLAPHGGEDFQCRQRQRILQSSDPIHTKMPSGLEGNAMRRAAVDPKQIGKSDKQADTWCTCPPKTVEPVLKKNTG